MRKRIIAALCSMSILSMVTVISAIDVNASESEQKVVDGSALTMDESSTGYSTSSVARGEYLMTGDCTISKAGLTRVYAYASTTANHEVDYIGVIVYVDRYNEETGRWGQIDWWMVTDEDDYFIITSKTLTVERGHYYRVHADHFARKDPDPIEETFSYTNGVWLP